MDLDRLRPAIDEVVLINACNRRWRALQLATERFEPGRRSRSRAT
jgi:hypothetical protein